MLRNYLSAALGNIGRNGFYAGITILGLAVSFAAAILIGLFLRDEYTFERFIPGHERVYRLEDDIVLPGQKPQPSDRTPVSAAAFFRLDFPEAEHVARLEDFTASLKRGDLTTSEPMFWADPDFFRVMPSAGPGGRPQRGAGCAGRSGADALCGPQVLRRRTPHRPGADGQHGPGVATCRRNPPWRG